MLDREVFPKLRVSKFTWCILFESQISTDVGQRGLSQALCKQFLPCLLMMLDGGLFQAWSVKNEPKNVWYLMYSCRISNLYWCWTERSFPSFVLASLPNWCTNDVRQRSFPSLVRTKLTKERMVSDVFLSNLRSLLMLDREVFPRLRVNKLFWRIFVESKISTNVRQRGFSQAPCQKGHLMY